MKPTCKLEDTFEDIRKLISFIRKLISFMSEKFDIFEIKFESVLKEIKLINNENK